MHSSLRKELRGTLKIVRSVRPRPTNRSFASRREFTSQTRLFDQPGSRDNNGTSASGNTASPTTDQSGSSSTTKNTGRGFGSEIEKWIQILSDQGQSPQVWDAVTEKDENGQRRLLPEIRKDLETIGDWAANEIKDGESLRSLAVKIEDGRIRPLKLGESQQADGLNATASSAQRGHADVRLGDGLENQDNEKVQQTPASTPTVAQQSIAQETDETSQHHFAAGGENPPQNLDSTPSARYYGSPAARRQRERQSRNKDRSHAIALPEWFTEHDVLVPGEGPLQPSAPRRVKFVNRVHYKYLRGEVDPPAGVSPATEGSAQAETALESQEMTSGSVEAASPEEKKQTFAADADEGSSSSDDKPSTASGDVPGGDPAALPSPPGFHKGYFLNELQLSELFLTIQGRLRLPTAGSLPNNTGGMRSHLIVHYAAPDGDLLLDCLMEDAARDLKSSLITLDAQDISSLISKVEMDPMMAEEAETFSYDVYGDVYKEEGEEEDQSAMFSDDMEDADDESGPGPRGGSFVVGKPITIDLKALFGPRGSRKGNSPFVSKSMMPEIFGRSHGGKPTLHMFSSLVDSILSLPQHKRRISDIKYEKSEASGIFRDDITKRHVTKDATIVHVKNLKAIQETNIGKLFLSQLFEQVQRRRSSGEGMIIIGTECARESSRHQDPERLKSMQVTNPDEECSTIVLTPGFPSNKTDGTLGSFTEKHVRYIAKRDRATRIQVINARHLYEMLQPKGVTVATLTDGFWTRDFTETLTTYDQEALCKGLWSFSHVQRLAAILASSDDFSNIKGISKSPIWTAAVLLESSDRTKEAWVSRTQTPRQRPGKKSKDAEESEDDKLAQIRSKASRYEKKLLSGVVEPGKIATTFQDIHIPSETVEALQTLTTLSLVRPDAFKYGVLASDRIPGLLLYGPPGTGKTLAAKAVARESGATMLEVSAADINDMYVGEGEKNVKALFSLAKKLSPCVVFLDEADAMFSARSNAGRRVSHRELLNQFLKEWDGMSNDSGSAFIMVATNRPMDLDDAVLRRLPRRLLVDLPTEKDRLEILKIHLRHELLAPDVDLASLASRTQFYSGSDLKNVAVAAALNCVREENELARKHTGDEPYQYADKRTLTPSHFEKALEEISASISNDMTSLREIKKFDEQYGDRKGRKRRSSKWGFKTASEADAVLDTVKVRS